MKRWMEPAEEVREAVLAYEVGFPPRWTRRVLVATDKYVYVMRQGFTAWPLITELLEKHDIQNVDVRPGIDGILGSGRSLLNGLRIASRGYTPTSLGGIRDVRKLYSFILNKQPN